MANCITCHEPNEYQDRPFTCGKCRWEAELRADSNQTYAIDDIVVSSGFNEPQQWVGVGNSAECTMAFFGVQGMKTAFLPHEGISEVYDSYSSPPRLVGYIRNVRGSWEARKLS